MDYLKYVDTKLLIWINQDLSNDFFDLFFPFWTDFQKAPIFQFVFLPMLLFFILKTHNWRLLKVLILGTLATFIADNINHIFIKEFFTRSRPTDVILRIPPQGSYSFPSSHAVDAFCLATFLALFYPRQKFIFYFIAGLTSFSRIYCGVHYPGDILAGAVVGTLMGYSFYLLLKSKRLRLKWILLFAIIASHPPALAWEDPTGGKPMFPWIWEDQLLPTINKSADKTGLIILGAGTSSTLAVRNYDQKIFDFNKEHPLIFNDSEAAKIGTLGDGLLGVGIFGLQLAFDQQNGLRHGRALILTSISHPSIALLVRRERPDQGSEFLPYHASFPSGHSASAFATAGSLAYSYGWKVGIPAYVVSSAISLSRLRSERHWASDIISGIFIGSFWARASFQVDEKDENSVSVFPSPIDDGLMIRAVKYF